jgi:hypothetical protein
MATPYEPFTDIPAVTPATPAAQVKGWFFLRRSQVNALAVQLGPRTDFDKDTMALLGARITSAESKLAQGAAPGTVVEEFQDWVGQYGDNGAWDYYAAWQKQQDQAMLDAQASAAGEKAVSDARNGAGQAAIAETRRRAGGLMSADGRNGRVIAGLAFVGVPGTAYTGISGRDMHAPSSPAADQVIAGLLAGIRPAEQWPLEACAEVDALKRYLTAAGIISAAGIPKDTLVFHAEVWHPGGAWKGKVSSPGWKSRGACANCRQWVGRIGALLA